MNRFEIVKKYIDEYDYYDLLACGAPNDEFDSYSRKFANTITEKDSIEDRICRRNQAWKIFGNCEIDTQRIIWR